jgi:hypothetical protein
MRFIARRTAAPLLASLGLLMACSDGPPTAILRAAPDGTEEAADASVVILDASRDSVRVFNGTSQAVAIQLWDANALAVSRATPCTAAADCPVLAAGATRSFSVASVAMFSGGTTRIALLAWSIASSGRFSTTTSTASIVIGPAPLVGDASPATDGVVRLEASRDSVIISNGTASDIRYRLVDAALLPQMTMSPCTVACPRVPPSTRLAIPRTALELASSARDVVLAWWAFAGSSRGTLAPTLVRSDVR